MSRVSELQTLVESVSSEMEKFTRKETKQLVPEQKRSSRSEKLAQDIRLEIQAKKNEG